MPRKGYRTIPPIKLQFWVNKIITALTASAFKAVMTILTSHDIFMPKSFIEAKLLKKTKPDLDIDRPNKIDIFANKRLLLQKLIKVLAIVFAQWRSQLYKQSYSAAGINTRQILPMELLIPQEVERYHSDRVIDLN